MNHQNSQTQTADSQAALNATAAIGLLKEGNQRFCDGNTLQETFINK